MARNKPKILIADDDESIRDMIAGFLQKREFEVITSFDGKDAVDKEEYERPDLVILDVEMPEMNGFEACRVIRKKRSGMDYIPIIFASGMIEEESVITGLQAGADEYIRKPFNFGELLNRISNLLKMKDLISRVESLENVIFTMVKSIEARDSYTAGHSRRVANISVSIARELGLPEEEIAIIREASLLHDVGKIGVPDRILNKKGKLIAEEFNYIKEHPGSGVDICSNLRISAQSLDILRHHHEKLDGSGYPDRLKGDEISNFVRIVTVADIFDALTSDRPYHPAKNNEESLSVLKQEANEGKLDVSVVNCMERLIQKKIVKE